ncbi:MAG: hypothetical protein IJ778_01800 [Alphaproteobacteria bacterium]|nr:hypothetical protein [Alphaproteobacteria bacterium]
MEEKEKNEPEMITSQQFKEYAVKAYGDGFGRFSVQAKEPVGGYYDGYGYVEFDKPREEFICCIWHGPHCVFGPNELVPNETIFSLSTSEPIFFTPAEIVAKFTFSGKNPFSGEKEPEGTPYWHGLMHIKRRIREFAKAKS